MRLARRICTSADVVETPDRNVATRLHSVGVAAEFTDGGLTHNYDILVPRLGYPTTTNPLGIISTT
jgi:hypothetical protein